MGHKVGDDVWLVVMGGFTSDDPQWLPPNMHLAKVVAVNKATGTVDVQRLAYTDEHKRLDGSMVILKMPDGSPGLFVFSSDCLIIDADILSQFNIQN